MSYFSKHRKESDLAKRAMPLALAGMAAAGCTSSKHYNQQDVDAEYARMYNEMKQSKEAAENEGRTLVVLLGEQHVSGFSYLYKMLVLDIARRLGISDVIEELDAPRVPAELNQRAIMANQKFDSTSIKLRVELNDLAGKPDKRLAELEPVVASQEALDHITPHFLLLSSARGSDRVRSQYPQMNWSPRSLETVFSSWKFTLHAADRERNDKVALDKLMHELASGQQMDQAELDRLAAAIMRDRQDPIVENAMVRDVQAFPKHSIAIFGAAHLPFLVEHLQAAQGKEILAYDIMHYQGEKYSPEVQARLDKNAVLAKQGNLRVLNISGSEPTYEAATQMALLASMQHRAACGEIDKKTAELFRIGLPIINELTNEGQQRSR